MDPTTDESYASRTLGTGQSVNMGERKVLGVQWDLATDQLVMSLEQIASAASELEPTKRSIVSLVGRIYTNSDSIEDIHTRALCNKAGLGPASD